MKTGLTHHRARRKRTMAKPAYNKVKVRALELHKEIAKQP